VIISEPGFASAKEQNSLGLDGKKAFSPESLSRLQLGLSLSNLHGEASLSQLRSIRFAAASATSGLSADRLQLLMGVNSIHVGKRDDAGV
jgi:hypothetical protein